MKKRMKFLSKLLIVALTLLVSKHTIQNVYAASAHKFELRLYDCNEVDSSFKCIDDSGNPINNPQRIQNNGDVNIGKVIRLDWYYVPGPHPDHTFGARIIYDGTKVEPIKRTTGKVYTKTYMTNTDNGGIWPPDPDENLQTLFTVTNNVNETQSRLTVLVEDATHTTRLENEGIIITYLFRVKDSASGDIAFTFDPEISVMGSSVSDQLVLSPITVKAYKELDADTSLSDLTVTSGSTNYLTNFNKDTKTYNVYVPNNVSSVTVTGTPSKDSTNAVTVPAGSQNLAVSTNKQFVVTTTAESGDTDEYTVNVYRLNNVATLSSLALSNVDIGTFSSGTTNYTASVPYTTDKTNITATATDATNATVTGTGNNKPLNVGENVFNIVVSPENCKSQYSSVPGNTCTTKTYKVTVTRSNPDTNAFLSDLKVNGQTVPNFSKTTYEYTIDAVSNSTTSVPVVATREVTTSTLSGDTSSKTLSVGNNQVKVTVTAQDGTTKHTYTVNVKRKSNVAELGSLIVTSSPQGTLNPSTFSASTKTYTYTVGPDVTNVSIAATPKANSGATVTGTGNYNPQNVNKAEIVVTPEDGTPVTYTVNLVRTKSTDVTLDELSVAGYTLSPAYSDSTNNYSVTVPSTETSVSVTATPHDNRTTAVVSGTTTNLQTGNNTVTVTVTPENGSDDARTITITVKKLDGDASLKSLSLSGVTLSPAFSSGTKNYTATVPYTTSSTTVSAQTTKTTSSITSGTGNINLTAGSTTTIKVKTKAEDPNVTDEYTVVVTRTAAATDNTLSDLRVDGTKVSGFDPNTLTYTLDAVDSTKASVNITATANNEFATIVSGTGSQNLTKNQNNALAVVVRSQAGVDKTYTINIRRKNDNAFLSNLTVTSTDGTISPSFNKNTTAYTYTVGPDVTSVSFTATCEDTTHGVVSGTQAIDPRTLTSKTIRCTAEDTNVYKDYVITIVRNKSQNMKLSNLVVEGYDINFDPDTLTYSLNIDSNVPSLTVTATKGDERQTLSDETQVITTTNAGDYTATVTVTAEDTTKHQDYVINIHKYSADALLQTLSLEGVTLSPAFSSGTTSYTATVPYTKETTSISATPISGASIVDGSDIGSKNLVVGNTNVFTITVKAEDNHTTKDYTVTVTRLAASGNAYLTDLKVNGSTVAGFDGENVFTYTLADVSSTTGSITIDATPNENSTIRTGDLGEKTLSIGNNSFEIVVIAQNGETRVPYTINVKKQNNDNKLSSLTITSDPAGTIDGAFDPNDTEYTYTVGPDVDSITIEATGGNGASIVGTGTYDPNVFNEVTITVTPEDPNVPAKTYTINLVREKSTDVTLDELSVAGYTISPSYADNVDSYNVTVPSNETSVSVTATPHDSRTTAVVSGTTTNLQTGDNTVTVTVTPESGDTDKRVITINVHKKNTDATLSSLSLDNVTLEPNFDPSITTYTATVPYTTTETAVNATPSDTSRTPVIVGDTNLGVGENTFTITVTPEEGDPVTYEVKVTREDPSSEVYLTGITVNGTAIEGFDKDTDTYTVDVANSITEAEIIGTANTNSTVEGNGTQTNLVIGDNGPYTITAKAQDGTTTKPYYVTIHRKDNNNKLSGLVITADPAGTLDTPFDPDTTEYTYTVGPDTPAITVTGTPAGGATVTGDGTFDPTTTDKIEVVVTPEDGTPQTYTINVVRNKSTNADLLSLGIDGYTISPSFDKDTILYTVTVPNSVDKVTVVAEKGDSRQNIEGLGQKNVVVGDNPLQVVVTPEDTTATPKTYTIKVTREANDNNYLQSLSVTGFNLKESFNKELQAYTLEVPTSTNSITVNASPEVTTSNVTITGADNLSSDTNTVTVRVVSQKGTPRDYVITVTKTDDAEYITSEVYGHTIADGMIKTVTYKTKPNELKDQLDNENAKLHIYANNTSIEEVDNNLGLATGYIVKLINNGVLKDSKLIVVKGDVDGDGVATLFDTVKILNHYLEKETLTGVYFEAADVDSDGEITLYDAVGALRIYLNDSE